MNIDWMTIVTSWGPIAAPVLAIVVRLWLLMEAEIKDGREARRKRADRDEANDIKAMGHMGSIREDVAAIKSAVDQIKDSLTRGGRQ